MGMGVLSSRRWRRFGILAREYDVAKDFADETATRQPQPDRSCDRRILLALSGSLGGVTLDCAVTVQYTMRPESSKGVEVQGRPGESGPRLSRS